VAAGIAYSQRLRRVGNRVFCLLSDGELDEGSNWEAILFSAHHQLDKLCVVIDYNKIQSLAPVSETLALEPLAAKFDAFGWEVRETDGHDHVALQAALVSSGGTRPVAVIAHTTKGRGVSFMENSVLWHYRIPAGDEYARAMAELGGAE
jgi:transketolase